MEMKISNPKFRVFVHSSGTIHQVEEINFVSGVITATDFPGKILYQDCILMMSAGMAYKYSDLSNSGNPDSDIYDFYVDDIVRRTIENPITGKEEVYFGIVQRSSFSDGGFSIEYPQFGREEEVPYQENHECFTVIGSIYDSRNWREVQDKNLINLFEEYMK